jgi:outer membrane biosynthesis protein TonB
MEFKITLSDKEVQTMQRLGTFNIFMELLTSGAEDAARDNDQIIEGPETVEIPVQKPEKKVKKETKVVETVAKVEEVETKEEEKAPEVVELDQVEVRRELTLLMKAGKDVKGEIAKLGFEKLTEVPKDKWQELLDAARAL